MTSPIHSVRPVPVVVLSGVDPDAMATTLVGLQFDLPEAVAVRHHIDVERGVLTRTVSDMGGEVERHEVLLEHACVTCALREDVVPTLERLARDGRWRTIVAHLPVGAEAAQLCTALSRDIRLARVLRVSSVVAAVSARQPVRDLLGDDLLAERGHHSALDDRRGVGEVLAAIIEHADLVTFDDVPDPVAHGLVGALARPGVPVATGGHGLPGSDLTGRLHAAAHTAAWTSPARSVALPPVRAEGVWRLDLQSLRPFDPARLLSSIEQLGAGAHRSRGCFWLPTRPGRVLEWDGAGGQLSIGDRGPWGERTPFTRIVLTGVGAAPAHLRPAFDGLLAAGPERVVRRVAEDGFEPWLGEIRSAA